MLVFFWRQALQDGYSLQVMAGHEYFAKIKQSPENKRCSGQMSASIAKFCEFYNLQLKQSGQFEIDEAWQIPAFVHRSSGEKQDLAPKDKPKQLPKTQRIKAEAQNTVRIKAEAQNTVRIKAEAQNTVSTQRCLKQNLAPKDRSKQLPKNQRIKAEAQNTVSTQRCLPRSSVSLMPEIESSTQSAGGERNKSNGQAMEGDTVTATTNGAEQDLGDAGPGRAKVDEREDQNILQLQSDAGTASNKAVESNIVMQGITTPATLKAPCQIEVVDLVDAAESCLRSENTVSSNPQKGKIQDADAPVSASVSCGHQASQNLTNTSLKEKVEASENLCQFTEAGDASSQCTDTSPCVVQEEMKACSSKIGLHQLFVKSCLVPQGVIDIDFEENRSYDAPHVAQSGALNVNAEVDLVMGQDEDLQPTAATAFLSSADHRIEALFGRARARNSIIDVDEDGAACSNLQTPRGPTEFCTPQKRIAAQLDDPCNSLSSHKGEHRPKKSCMLTKPDKIGTDSTDLECPKALPGESDSNYLDRLTKVKESSVASRRWKEAACLLKEIKQLQKKLGVDTQQQATLQSKTKGAEQSSPQEDETKQKSDTSKVSKEPLASADNGGDVEGDDLRDPVDFARGILREKFPIRNLTMDVHEDESEVVPANAHLEPRSRKNARGKRAADAANNGETDEVERRQDSRAELARIPDASYNDIARFPAVAATFREHLEEAAFEEVEVGPLVRALHELFAQDEKALNHMAQKSYANVVSENELHARAIEYFAEFWEKRGTGPFVEPAPRAERGCETRLRREHGIPEGWQIRVVQRAHKEDLAIFTSREGKYLCSPVSELQAMPAIIDPNGEFAIERARRAAMTELDKLEEAARQEKSRARIAAATDRARKEERLQQKTEEWKAELAQGLRDMTSQRDDGINRIGTVSSLLCRQHLACGKCGRVSASDAAWLEEGSSMDSEEAAAIAKRSGWASYDDVPDATEQEIAQYPQILATFHLMGFPYLTGLRKLMELYRKRPTEMATLEFQRLVRHDPENAQCNGFLNSAILYFIKFRDAGGFNNLADMSAFSPDDIEKKFTPDFTKTAGLEQTGFDDLQIEIPLELLMADATENWTNELVEMLDQDCMIQEDVDASGYHSKPLSIALLPDATSEEWQMWPRILAKYEVTMKELSQQVLPIKKKGKPVTCFLPSKI